MRRTTQPLQQWRADVWGGVVFMSDERPDKRGSQQTAKLHASPSDEQSLILEGQDFSRVATSCRLVSGDQPDNC